MAENTKSGEKYLMKGNEALAEAAIRAGCKCFFGYPITPQTELAAYMAKQNFPKRKPDLSTCIHRHAQSKVPIFLQYR